MRPYILAPHVRACVGDHGAVLLDLEHDAYLGFDPDQARVLCALVEGLDPANAGEAADGFSAESLLTEQSQEARDLVQSLRERALLESASAVALPPAAHVVPAEAELLPWDRTTWSAIRLDHVIAFLRAFLTATFLIKCRSFACIVDRVRRRKAHFDVEAARALLSAYVHIRLFVFAPKGRCLLDSLTLLEYLAQYGLYPDWIIGVQINPFASHSWLQHGHFVLSGTPHYVRAYTPILVI